MISLHKENRYKMNTSNNLNYYIKMQLLTHNKCSKKIK